MSHSIFDSEVSFMIEKENNRYAAIRALSMRARDINIQSKATSEADIRPELSPEEPSPVTKTLSDYAEGRVILDTQDFSQEKEQ